jgi:hypothetical protein
MFNSSSPRALAVKPYSIGTNVVSTNLAGFSLTGGGGLPLSLTNFPSTLITNIGPGLAGGANPTNPALNIPLFVTNVDFAQLSSNALAGLTNFVTTIVTTIVTNQFILSGVPVPSAYTVTTNAHGLGVTPGFVRAVLVCVTADLGWVPGDELDVHSLGNASGGLPVVMTSANSSNVNLTLYGTGAQAWLAVRKDNVANTYAGITPGRWTIKVIARP